MTNETPETTRFVAAGGFVTVEAPKDICDAVAERARYLIPRIYVKPGAYVYTGYRTKPEELGWRFIQMHGEKHPCFILAGEHDEQIVETFHEAASAQHWYDYEKDYGDFD